MIKESTENIEITDVINKTLPYSKFSFSSNKLLSHSLIFLASEKDG